jgi:hypothetical protein
MGPSFHISIDRDRSLMRLKLSGFFDRSSVAKMVVERNAAVKRLGCAPNMHVTFCDLSDYVLSSPEIVGEFQTMVADPRYSSRRLAFVIDASLARMQVRRIAKRTDVGYFLSADEAETWLFAA